MNYLDIGQIKPMVNKGKIVEQFLSIANSGDYSIIKWISIYKDKDKYCLELHEVFDDREDGNENIYDFSYVEPDDMYGKRIYQTKEFELLIEWVQDHFSVSLDKFLPFDYLNEELEKQI